MDGLELLKEHCKFEDKYDCYVILAVSRKKDTPEITNSQEIVFRDVLKSEKDLVRKYNKIKASLISYRDDTDKQYPFYLYVSSNPRNSRNATFSLVTRINAWVLQELHGVDNSKMFKKLHGFFYSELMKKENRGSSKEFMIDFDEKDPKAFIEILQDEDIELILTQQTRNGYHFIVKPFNLVAFKDKYKGIDYDIKKDANLFVEYVGVV